MDTYYWIIVYNDDKAIPEYDLESGDKNGWKLIPHDSIKEIIWKPFDSNLLGKIKSSSPDNRISLPFLPTFRMKIPDNAEPVAPYRTQEIIEKKRLKCLVCGHVFKDSEADHFTYKYRNLEMPICPKCGATDVFVCEHCGYEVRDTEGRDVCPKCGKKVFWQYKRNIIPLNMEERHTYYHLGYVLNNHKFEIVFDEFGNTKLI